MILRGKQGFTLIELMVGIAIIAIMTGIFLINYQSSNRRSSLTFATQKAANGIRTVEGYAMGLKLGVGGANPPGWGIYFPANTSSYYIFTDNNANNYYDSGELYQKDIFTKGVLTGMGASTTIVFIPPDPLVYINNSTTSTSTVKLFDYIVGSQKELEINPFGLVDIK